MKFTTIQFNNRQLIPSLQIAIIIDPQLAMAGCRVPESHLSDGLENVLGATGNLER